MKLLFADSYPQRQLDELSAAGHDCTIDPTLDAASLPTAIGDHDALIVRSTRVTRETIEAGSALTLVVRAGAGTNTIDKIAAAEAAVYVCNVPGQNAVAVAELTMGLLLAIDRHIATGCADLRNGVWNKKTYSNAQGLAMQTMGIVGLGDIGVEVAKRASAFEMRVLGVAKQRSEQSLERLQSAGVEFVDSMEELLAASDVVSFHVPLNDNTRSMVDGELLAKMKPEAILLNTSRGEIVDEAALLDALGRGLRAGLDVYANEPGSGSGRFESAVAAHPNVVGSHHIGASTAQAQDAVANGVVEIIDAFALGRVLNCVNLHVEPRGTATVVARHRNRVGVLAAMLHQLRENGLNVEQMDNRIFDGAAAAVATIRVEGEISENLLDDLRSVDNVLAVSVN